VRLELLQLPGCASCSGAAAQLKEVAFAMLGLNLDWRELDISRHVDYAVDLGVLSAPALAIDGELAFVSLPSPQALSRELLRRLGGQPGDRP